MVKNVRTPLLSTYEYRLYDKNEGKETEDTCTQNGRFEANYEKNCERNVGAGGIS